MSIILIFLACLFLFFYKLGARPLWDYDEAKHAQVAKEMLQKGDWCTPTFMGDKFYDKPILHFWLILLSYSTFGVNEWAARLPSAVLGIAGVFLVYLWARRIYGTLSGILSSLVLATSIEYIILTQNIIHDLSLAFFINLALFQFYIAVTEKKFSYSSCILFYAALGCAVLAKGPVGLVLPGLIIVVFLLMTKQWQLLYNKKLALGICIFLAVALPWYVLMAMRHPDYLQKFLIEGNLSRFLSAKAKHREAFYYYLPVLAVGFFPWSIFLPAAGIYHIKKYLSSRSHDTLLILLSALVPFLFFSLSRSKLPTYIIPVFPALAILTGTFWACCMSRTGLEKGANYFTHSCVALFLINGVAIVAGTVYLSRSYPQYLPSALPFLIFLFITGLICLYCGLKKKAAVACGTVIIMMITLIAGINRHVFPEVSHFKSARELARTVKKVIPEGGQIVFYRDLRESVVFYAGRTGRIIGKPDQIEAYLNAPGRVYCVIHSKQYEKLKDVIHAGMYPVDQEGDRMLISNKKSDCVKQEGSM